MMDNPEKYYWGLKRKDHVSLSLSPSLLFLLIPLPPIELLINLFF